MSVVSIRPGARCIARLGLVLTVVALAAVSALLSACPATAASLGISPTRVELTATQATAGVRVSNQAEDAAVNVQARLFRWWQEDGQDRYAPTDDLTVSPPLTRIAPGREHLIRLVREGPAPEQGEHSYRLLLDELPEPEQAAAAATTGASSSLSMVIRQLIPVFVTHPQATPAAPQWQIERVSGGNGRPAGYRVSVHNTGQRRLRLSELTLATVDGAVLAQRPGLVGYALGGARMQFLIPDVEGGNAVAASLMLSVQSETGPLSAGPLPVSADGN